MKKTFLVLLLFFIFAPAFAGIKIPEKPYESVYVQDYADIIGSESEHKINEYGKWLDEKTKAQIAVVTVNSLEGYPIEDYSLEILREWGVGDKELDNGIVVLVSLSDRQSRIEVGYGLEGRITDAGAGNIQDEYMLPYFKQGDYDKGIVAGYTALLVAVSREYGLDVNEDILKYLEDSKPGSGAEDSVSWQNIIFFIAVFIIVVIHFIRGGNGRNGRGGGGPGNYGRYRGRPSGGGRSGFGGGSGGGGGASRRW